MAEFKDWNTTAANNNTSTPAEGYMQEGMSPSNVNNAYREGQATLARWLADNNGSLETAGSSDTALTLAPAQTYTANYVGATFKFRTHRTIASGVTLQVGSGADAPLQDIQGNAINATSIENGSLLSVVYVAGGWRVLNSTAALSLVAGDIPAGVAGVASIRNDRLITQNLEVWSGTQAQYDAIGTKDNNTLYFVDT